MTNPNVPDGKPDNVEKRQAPEAKPDSPSISFGEVMPQSSRDQVTRAASEDEQAKDGKTRAELNLDQSAVPGAHGTGRTTAGTPFTYYMGKRPQFQSRQSEFLAAKLERPPKELRPLVDKFLKETPHAEEHRLTEAEQRELEKTRTALAKTTTAAEALHTALQLATLYQHLRCVEEAKKATDLSLGIDPDNQLGRQLFKELEHVRPADISIRQATPGQLGKLTKAALRERIKNLSGGRIIVVGDMIVDEFLEGKPERISREAPVLILEHVDTELALGGAANAAHNIAALGGICKAIGVCGRDQNATKLAELFDKAGIAHSLVQDQQRPTTVKTRILSKAHALKQQLLRLDHLSREPVSGLVETLIVDKVKQAAGQYAAIILSDYRAGVVTDAIVRTCRIIAAERNLALVVDAQDRLDRFQNVTALTPNEPDTEKAVGYAIDSEEALNRAGRDLLDLTAAQAILITRGARGMSLFEKGAKPVTLPPFNKSEVFDVTGAGDTVVAAMTLALVTGCSFIEAVALGNLAAGTVVRKSGTATTSPSELLEALESTDLPD